MYKVIFLHCMFRAGSTYMFNKFRVSEKFTTYYEPLHHDLIRLRKNSIDIWKFNEKATRAMNHPSLNKPHFYEFQTAFKSDDELLPFFDGDFSYKEFFSVQKDNQLKKYIDNLIDATDADTIPVFQFNRTSLRIDWFKKNYQNSLNVFLLRNPRDQFESYIQRGDIGKNIFLAINLYILMLNKKAYFEVFNKQVEFEPSSSVAKDLSTCVKLCKNYKVEEHYKIFFYIWLLSYMHAKENVDLIIDMDKLNTDKECLENIEKMFEVYTGEKLDFDDYRIKNNDFLSISFVKVKNIEKKVMEMLDLKQEIKEEAFLYLSGFQFQNKKETFFSKIISKVINI